MTQFILVATLGCRSALTLMQAVAIVAGFAAVTLNGTQVGVHMSRHATGAALFQICRWSNPTQLPPKPDARSCLSR